MRSHGHQRSPRESLPCPTGGRHAPHAHLPPQIVADGTGRAFVTWEDLRSGSDYDVHARHLLATGAVDPAWTADREPLCSAVGVFVVGPTRSDPTPPAMLAPYPNPSTRQPVEIPVVILAPTRVSIEVIGLAGWRVRLLADGHDFTAGRHILEWDGRNDARAIVPAGIYFVCPRAETCSVTRRRVKLN